MPLKINIVKKEEEEKKVETVEKVEEKIDLKKKEERPEDLRKNLLLKIHGVPTDKNARSYIRVSTRQQASEGWSLQVQESRLAEYCRLNGLNLIEKYSDEGISAKDYKNRPSLMKLLEDLKPLETVVTVSLSRIARNARQFDDIYDAIQKKGSYLVMLDMNIDTSTANSKFQLAIMKQFAELERDLISERVKITMRSKIRDGELKTKPMFGWAVVNGVRVEDEKEQAIISYIRSLRKQDPRITISEICEILKKNNIKIRKSKAIYPETIKRIIINNNI